MVTGTTISDEPPANVETMDDSVVQSHEENSIFLTNVTKYEKIVTKVLPVFTLSSEIPEIVKYKDPKTGLIEPFQDMYHQIYYPHCKFDSSVYAFELRIYGLTVQDLHGRPISSHVYINLILYTNMST
jgi:hypothetical protein